MVAQKEKWFQEQDLIPRLRLIFSSASQGPGHCWPFLEIVTNLESAVLQTFSEGENCWWQGPAFFLALFPSYLVSVDSCSHDHSPSQNTSLLNLSFISVDSYPCGHNDRYHALPIHIAGLVLSQGLTFIDRRRKGGREGENMVGRKETGDLQFVSGVNFWAASPVKSSTVLPSDADRGALVSMWICGLESTILKIPSEVLFRGCKPNHYAKS